MEEWKTNFNYLARKTLIVLAKFGVVHLAINDHALIYMTYKVEGERAGTGNNNQNSPN